MGPLLPVGRSLAVLNSALLVQLPVTGIPGICLPCFQEVISSWWLQSFREGAHPDLVLRPKSACRVKGARKPPRFLRCSQHQGGP